MSKGKRVALTALVVVVVLACSMGPTALLALSGADVGVVALVGVILGGIWGYAGASAYWLIWS